MLAPETDAYASVIRFRVPAGERRVCSFGAVALVLAVLSAWFLWNVPTELRLVTIAAASAATLWLLLRACHDELIEVDVEADTYRRRSGIEKRMSVCSLSEREALRLEYTSRDEAASADGLPTRVYSAWLVRDTERLPLVKGWGGRQAQEFLALLADRLGIPLQPARVQDSTRRPGVAQGSLLMWAGVLFVFGLMFWPVLSGRRPLRPVWASTFRTGPPVSKEVALFEEGTAKYREGSYAEAERLFAESIAAGTSPSVGYNMIAYAQAQQKHLDDALRTAEKALSYDPRSGIILDTVGEMHELRREYDLAIDFYEQALRQPDIAPGVETNAKLGRTLLALGRRKRAVEHLRVAAMSPGEPYGQVAISILGSIGEHVPYPEPPRQQKGIRNAMGTERN